MVFFEKFKGSENFRDKFKGSEILREKNKGSEKIKRFWLNDSRWVPGLINDRPLILVRFIQVSLGAALDVDRYYHANKY